MAGDWIPFDHDLPEKREVLGIIEVTGESVEVVVYRLLLLWRMADRHTGDGIMHGVGPKSLAATIGGKVSFWEAVASVGWIIFDDGKTIIPDFVKRFRKSSKVRREDSAERKRLWREHKKTEKITGHNAGHNAGQPCDNTSTAKSPDPMENGSPLSLSLSLSTCPNGQVNTVGRKRPTAFVPPMVEEVRVYCQERGNVVDPEQFVDHYTARDWRFKGGGKMKDWKASVRTWEKNDFRQNGNKSDDPGDGMAKALAELDKEFGHDVG